MSKNYYDILGVKRDATEKEIKSQYYKLSKQYHPDVNPEGEEKFKEISEAYSILGNPEKRKAYDTPQQSFSDFFFNNFTNQTPKIILKHTITVTESYKGFSKTIEYDRPVNCDSCNGAGGEHQTCGMCKGTGYMDLSAGNSFISQTFRVMCNSCGGRGAVISKLCAKCSGKGKTATKANVEFKAYAGIEQGAYIIGNDGTSDIIVHLEIVNDDFSRDGDRLIYNLVLENNEIFANEIMVPHPDGQIKLFLPNVYDTRKPIRLKGKGFRGGDYLIKIDVSVKK